MSTSLRSARVAALALAGALALSACADDTDDAASPSSPISSPSASASASPSPTAVAIGDFCAAQIAVDAAFLAGGPPQDEPATPSPEQIAAKKAALTEQYGDVYDELERTAQPAVADAVAAMASAARSGIESANGEFTFEPTYAAADAEVDEFLTESCGFEELSATAADYEFDGLPATTPAGQTAITLANEGEEEHEIVLLRMNDGVTLSAEELLELPMEELFTQAMPAAIALASPGTSGTAFADLEAGRYAVACFIPKGTKPNMAPPQDAPPHFVEGMLADLTVT